MKRAVGIVTWLMIVFGVSCPCVFAQKADAPPTASELARILRIKTFRVRMPVADFSWDLEVLKRDAIKPPGEKPTGLTTGTGLLSMRDKGGGVYEITVPEHDGGYGQGDFDICKEISCSDQFMVHWLKNPIYSADGTQCVLEQFSNLGDDGPSAFIVLVKVNKFLGPDVQ